LCTGEGEVGSTGDQEIRSDAGQLAGVSMSNLKPLPVQHFIEKLLVELRAGYGIVPFVGSGVSASSGILMGQEFDRYLAWIVRRCVAGNQKEGRLDLRRQGWPQMPESDNDLREAVEWIKGEFEELCKTKYKMNFPAAKEGVLHFMPEFPLSEPDRMVAAIQRPLIPRVLRDSHTLEDDHLRSFWQLLGTDEQKRGWCMKSQDSPTSYDHILEAALRSLHDWRATLYFLARLRLVHFPKEHLILADEVDQSIIDKFNLHITSGRRPNLSHNMLCHLAGPARIRTILTTNFDTLIEDALDSFRMRYEVIPVSIKGDLPHPDTVHSLNCVVKMHGALAETRADYSLDDPPAAEDKNRFYHFVCGHRPDEMSRPGTDFIPSHLVVVGYSGADTRCVQMIKYVLDLNPQTKVFWICYCQSDFERLGSIFQEPSTRSRSSTGRMRSRWKGFMRSSPIGRTSSSTSSTSGCGFRFRVEGSVTSTRPTCRRARSHFSDQMRSPRTRNSKDPPRRPWGKSTRGRGKSRCDSKSGARPTRRKRRALFSWSTAEAESANRSATRTICFWPVCRPEASN
jgi:hypothetical protein